MALTYETKLMNSIPRNTAAWNTFVISISSVGSLTPSGDVIRSGTIDATKKLVPAIAQTYLSASDYVGYVAEKKMQEYISARDAGIAAYNKNPAGYGYTPDRAQTLALAVLTELQNMPGGEAAYTEYMVTVEKQNASRVAGFGGLIPGKIGVMLEAAAPMIVLGLVGGAVAAEYGLMGNIATSAIPSPVVTQSVTASVDVGSLLQGAGILTPTSAAALSAPILSSTQAIIDAAIAAPVVSGAVTSYLGLYDAVTTGAIQFSVAAPSLIDTLAKLPTPSGNAPADPFSDPFSDPFFKLPPPNTVPPIDVLKESLPPLVDYGTLPSMKVTAPAINSGIVADTSPTFLESLWNDLTSNPFNDYLAPLAGIVTTLPAALQADANKANAEAANIRASANSKNNLMMLGLAVAGIIGTIIFTRKA